MLGLGESCGGNYVNGMKIVGKEIVSFDASVENKTLF
jgi:hypothetical protein